MEYESKNRTRRVRVEQIVLGTLMTTGVIGMAVLAPNALKLLKHVDLGWASKRDPRQRLYESVSRLKHKGLVEFRFEKGIKRLRLTKKGEQKANSIWQGGFQIKKPRRWDGKWRLVIFDIPERRRPIRDKIRSLVSNLGFLHLQDSVWVYPYDCEELITLLKTDLKIGRAVLYVIADAIEFDIPIRKYFGLPPK